MVNIKTLAYSGLATLGLSATTFAASSYTPSGGITNIAYAAGQLCGQLTGLLPVISMLMIIAAGVVYAAGQIMGAETRARANTWATAMLVGSIIGIVITLVAPGVLATLYSNGNLNTPFSCSSYTP